ncbi:MAG: HD domain-containing phosphohydrolase [Candidatus Korobacteraceae bacterium]
MERERAKVRPKLPALRIPILYLILSVLILVSVVPMYFYARRVMADSRRSLIINEQLLQGTVTRAVGDGISQRHRSLASILGNLSSAIQISSGGDLRGQNVSAPELRALLEQFVSATPDVAFAILLNSESKGISVPSLAPDEFLHRELERAFTAALEGRVYTSPPLPLGSGKNRRVVSVVTAPVTVGGHFMGMIGTAVDLTFLATQMHEGSRGGLQMYIVDRQGRLVVSADPHLATGQDMTRVPIVKNFVESGGKAHVGAATSEFSLNVDGEEVAMLGTYTPVPVLEWAVMAQKPQRDAYASVFVMQEEAQWLAVVLALLSLLIGIGAASWITKPLQVLTNSSRAIAKGDFSQRVKLNSRTEIGELAQTFNHMTEDLERFVAELKRAAEENRALFLGSIQMLAGAVDEKDPYTRGHSDRVTKYSVILAGEMGLSEEQIEVVRIAAQLHDVGKIGIEDRILKKPGALTPEEFEVMKTHTVRGANILRPIAQLKEMIPGIELHHEARDGRGYPFGLQGDQIPTPARIIAVADTFDAMTTNRPYQVARDPEDVLKIIQSLQQTKFDPSVVAALIACLESGRIRVARPGVTKEERTTSEQRAEQVVSV